MSSFRIEIEEEKVIVYRVAASQRCLLIGNNVIELHPEKVKKDGKFVLLSYEEFVAGSESAGRRGRLEYFANSKKGRTRRPRVFFWIELLTSSDLNL